MTKQYGGHYHRHFTNGTADYCPTSGTDSETPNTPCPHGCTDADHKPITSCGITPEMHERIAARAAEVAKGMPPMDAGTVARIARIMRPTNDLEWARRRAMIDHPSQGGAR